MAESLINNSNTESNNPSHTVDVLSDRSPFRKIEFHMARKPYTGFTNGGGNFRLETLNPTTSSNAPQRRPGSSQVDGPLALTGKKRDGWEFLEHGLDAELSFGITFRRIGAGLENLGNTCFLNSVLQCLTYTEPLAAYLQSGKHQVSCRNAGFCALCAIQKHVSRALQSTGRILAPKDLVSNLRCISRNFRNSRQEDAHEYMVNLLESMHKCCLPLGVPSESPSAYDKSLVHKIFGGRLRSQVKCMQCNFCSDKFDPFLDLSLEIVKADTLYKAFTHFTAKEQLDGGGRQYQCQQCKQKVKALKQLTIQKAPYVLTIHLKRFDSHISGQKIDKKIQFGSTLDLEPFVTGPYDGNLKYTLYGVLVHAGWSTHSGHYYCFVRTSTGMWYSLDDNQVVQVSEKTVFEQKAYMLFYFRDRKFFPPKKPVDVMQKEKMVINGMGINKTFPNINDEVRDTIRSCALENASNGPSSSLAVPQRNAASVSASKESLMKEVAAQEVSCLTTCSAFNGESHIVSSPKVPPLNDLLRGPSVLHQTEGLCLPQSGSSVEESSHTLKLDAMNMPPGATIVECIAESSTKKDLSNSTAIPSSRNGPSTAIPSSRNGPQNSLAVKDKHETVYISVNCEENRSANKDLSDSTAIPTNCSVPPISPEDTCITENTCTEKIEDVSQEVAGGESPGDSAGDDRQITVDTVSAEFSSLPKIKSFSLKQKALAHKPHGKLKKKFMKCQVTSMHLGSNILIGTSLSLWKRKKHKRSKKCTLLMKNLRREDLGPSSSKKIKTMPLGGGLTNSHRKGVKSDTKNEGKTGVVENVGTRPCGDISMNTVDKEFKERIHKHGAVLATVDQLEKSSGRALAGSQSDSKGQNSFEGCRRNSMQNGLMSMLSRGLEETTVAHWDEIEPSLFRITESGGGESMCIGYVADEWDEEYDRGKRKKVRNSRDQFDGQNPFQEIATKKAKLNKSKLFHSSSGNLPFRI